MYPLQIIIAILVIVSVIFAQPIDTGDSNEIHKPTKILTQKELLDAAKKFKCNPQQRTILVQDLLKENNIMLETDEKIAVLNSIPMYRCDQQSGCCIRPGQICAELESEPVVLQFRAHKLDKTSRLIEIHDFNHTKCACQNMTEIKRRINNESIDPSVDSLTSSGLANSQHEHKLLLCVASLLYFIYLF